MQGEVMSNPRSVRAAVWLLVFGLALASVSVTLNVLNAPESLSRPVMATFAVTSLSIQALFVYFIWLGKNWARIVFSAFLAIGIFVGIGGPKMEGVHHWFALVNYWIGMGIGVTTLILLFIPASNGWFREGQPMHNHSFESDRPRER
jgi:hypothetical protein